MILFFEKLTKDFCSSGYDGQQTCITYEAVNQAYIEARQRIRKYWCIRFLILNMMIYKFVYV